MTRVQYLGYCNEQLFHDEKPTLKINLGNLGPGTIKRT
jgi:hypothetical protein